VTGRALYATRVIDTYPPSYDRRWSDGQEFAL
jgi:hypothetical protein